jgi:hypothetical protein
MVSQFRPRPKIILVIHLSVFILQFYIFVDLGFVIDFLFKLTTSLCIFLLDLIMIKFSHLQSLSVLVTQVLLIL